ncbi:anthrone oxygenase family protein [Glycomyces xiaoerkulensis]|uniref:anthrone oxygenase family protein n=1 Tax=Glycomyces xiaoerkulensis TaxID=2038139 RepID=UPI0018E49C3B|nr:anthrone oxygenase family protein [Glycomyces xiaoerkulensis]
MDAVRIAVLVAALVLVGLMAGVFFAYSVSVMPGLGRTDDRTFVGAFQAVDRAILNPVFLSVFVGALLATAAAAVLYLVDGRARVATWAIVAFALYFAAVAITGRVHVPRNDEIKAAGEPDGIDPAVVRERFSEDVWRRWNTVRVLLSTASLVCLAVAVSAL